MRYPEIVRDLGERRFHLLEVARIRAQAVRCRISDDVRLLSFDPDRLDLGESVTVSAGTILAFGDAHNGFSSIRIGSRTWIGEYNNIRAGGGDIEIGEDCLISQFCTLVSSNHSIQPGRLIREQPPATDRSGIRLGNDVWLGAGVVITAGVEIGDGAVIGAGAVVTRNVPSNEIWGGVPAGRISARENPERS